METRRLQYFVQIVDAGSINRAAAVTGIAQSALSQQLTILRQVGSLKLELMEVAEAVAGVVAIGLPPGHGRSIGGELLNRVLTEYPQVRLQIVEARPTLRI